MKFLANLVERYQSIRSCLREPGPISFSSYTKYPENCTFNGRKVLNVGCDLRTYKAKNVVNIDINPYCGANVVADLSKPLPFKDEEFDFIFANHSLEHIPEWWECFKELARVCKKGGLIEIWVPAEGHSWQLTPKGHINFIGEVSFNGVANTGDGYKKYPEYYSWYLSINKHLQGISFVSKQTRVENIWWYNLLPRTVLKWMCDHLRNIAVEQQFLFKKVF